MSGIFNNAIFNNAVFNTGFIASSIRPSGGIPATLRIPRRTRKDIRRARKLFGIPDEAAEVIATVAARQVDHLEGDAQKRFEELRRELQLRRLEWRSGYLEALNAERERLIDAEIARLLRVRNDNEELMMLVALAATL